MYIHKEHRHHFHRHNKLFNTIIKLLIVGVALSSPYGSRRVVSMVAREISRKFDELSRITEEDIRNSLHQLRRRKFIAIKVSKNGRVRVELTRKGKKRFLALKIENIEIKKPKRWDGKWRIVVFDIPERYKTARDALRQKLKQLGFFRIQKSIWVYPFPCKDEIDFICEFFGVEEFVLLWTVTLEGDIYLQRHFRLG